jgi:hypothetical protein
MIAVVVSQSIKLALLRFLLKIGPMKSKKVIIAIASAIVILSGIIMADQISDRVGNGSKTHASNNANNSIKGEFCPPCSKCEECPPCPVCP